MNTFNIFYLQKPERKFRRKITLYEFCFSKIKLNYYLVPNRKRLKKLKTTVKETFYDCENFSCKNAKGDYIFSFLLKQPPKTENFAFVDENLKNLNVATSLQNLFLQLTVVSARDADDYLNSIYFKTGAYPAKRNFIAQNCFFDYENAVYSGFFVPDIKECFPKDLVDVLPESTDFYGLKKLLDKKV